MNRTMGPRGTALVIGAGGGVARAVLAVLAETALGRAERSGAARRRSVRSSTSVPTRIRSPIPP
jgi:hypothetical protein